MGNNSDNLAADLTDLKVAGMVKLPEMARHYAQASRDLHNSGFYDDAEAPAMASIAVFRDAVQNCMAITYQNLIDNGRALVSIAEDYATTDAEAARMLTENLDERFADPDSGWPLPPMPVAKTSKDEQYEITRRTETVPGTNGPVTVEIEEPVR